MIAYRLGRPNGAAPGMPLPEQRGHASGGGWSGHARGAPKLTRRSLLAVLLASPVMAAPAPPDVLLVGDSLAYQLGPRLAKALPEGKRLAYDGRGGTSARQWLKLNWFRRALLRHEAQIVLVSLGVNCIRSERPVLKDHVSELRALAADRRCIWLLPPPLRFNTDYIRAATEGGETFDPGALSMESDRIHPSHAGHKQWAKLIVEHIYGKVE